MKVNTTIDNVSPSITYLPAADWAAGTHADTSWTQYYQSTYQMCSKAGDNATFTFNGTGVWLYGALRSNHGLYNVTLDGVVTTHDGFAAGDGLYQQVLFGASDLDSGAHSVTVTNNRNSSTYANFDLDFIIWEEEIGTGDDTLGSQQDDDVAAAFVYGPANTAWSTLPANPAGYHGGTGHTTVTAAAYVTYSFIGSSVSIFGALGPSQGPYTVSLDGAAAINYSAANLALIPQQLLYHASGLDNTTHTVQIINAPATLGQALDIDYAVVNFAQVPIVTTTSTTQTSTSTSSTSSDSATDTSLPTQSSAPTENKKGLATGAIIAIVLGVLALLAMLSFALMMYRRKKKREEEDEPDMMTVYPEPYSVGGSNDGYGGPGRYIPPSQNMHDGYNPLNSAGVNSTPLYPPSRGPYDQPGFAARQQEYFPSSGQQVDGASLFSGLAPAMPRQSPGRPRLDSSSTGHGYGSEVASTAPWGRDSAYTGVSNGSSRMPAHGHSSIGGPDLNAPLPPVPPLPSDANRRFSNPPLGLHQPPPSAPGLIPPRKGQVTLPPSATPEQQAEFRGLSPDEIARRRMNVEGREQDFGPLIMDDPLHVAANVPLPPNYAQATETFKR